MVSVNAGAPKREGSGAGLEAEASHTPPSRKRVKTTAAGFAAVLETEDTEGERGTPPH